MPAAILKKAEHLEITKAWATALAKKERGKPFPESTVKEILQAAEDVYKIKYPDLLKSVQQTLSHLQ